MAFPPNYSQERNNRDRGKNRKAQEKLQKREDKAAQRKAERSTSDTTPAPNEIAKDPK